MKQKDREPVYRRNAITIRAVVIGLLLIPPNAWWQVQSEAVIYLAHPTGFSLLFNVVWILLALVCLNVAVKKLVPRHALQQGELITVYVMLCQATALGGHSFMQILPQTLAAPIAWATPENDWQNLFGYMIPDWLAVADRDIVGGYAGAGKDVSNFFNGPTMRAWLVPILLWSAFISVLVFVMICLNAILRRRWTDHEKLTYPIVQLPYEMTEPSMNLFRSPLFWVSFTLVGLLDVVNGLHVFYPVIPSLRVPIVPIGRELFTRSPWDAMGGLAISFRPFLIGIILLIPLEISFSCWTLYFYWKAQLVVARLLGWHGAALYATETFPVQAGGVYAGVTLVALWMGRHHFRNAFVSIWDGLRDEGRRPEEAMSYRTASLGFLIGLGLLVAFSVKAGMTPWAAIIYFVLYLIIATGVTRIRAEVGSPVHALHWAGPEEMMVDALGTRAVGRGNLMVMSFFWFMSRAHYSDVMPQQIEGLRMGSRAGMNLRRMAAVLVIGSVVGIVVAFVALVDSGYRSSHVALAWGGTEPMNRLARWFTNPAEPDPIGVGLFSSGILLVVMMMVMRTRFIWWPFHPVGFAVSLTGWWFMFFLAWAVKFAIVKQGGIVGLRKATPFFMGLILGEFAVGGFWALLGVVIQVKTFGLTAWW